MQDWAYEVADPSGLGEYLSLFAEVQDDDDIRFTLADIIIRSFEELDGTLEEDDRWNVFLDDLAEKPKLHVYQIWYWSCFDVSIDDAWRVAPFMRSQYARFV